MRPEIAVDKHIAHRKFFGFNLAFGPNYIADRIPLMVNNDVQLSMAAPTESMVDQYFKNATADEVIFIHHGEGVMHSIYGELPLSPEIMWLFREARFIKCDGQQKKTNA